MTSSNKRERQLARAKYERQHTRREQAAEARKRRQRVVAIVVVAGLVLASGGWVVVSRLTQSADAPVAAPAASAAASAAAAIDCAPPAEVRADDITFDAAPESDPAGGVLTVSTNCGDIVISTLPDAAPRTVASMEFLAGEGFFDRTACHRLTTEGIFVLQCGDPAGNGSGGPGYSVPDENLPAQGEVNYPAGTVAMANAGPGTGGSQFFLVYEDTTLGPDYTVWGTITEGLDVVRGIAAAGVTDGASDGQPNQPVVIESVRLAAS